MSAKKIIAELSRLNRIELEAVNAKLRELLEAKEKSRGRSSLDWGRKMTQFAGAVEGLPADYALNHDHYLHGSPKR